MYAGGGVYGGTRTCRRWLRHSRLFAADSLPIEVCAAVSSIPNTLLYSSPPSSLGSVVPPWPLHPPFPIRHALVPAGIYPTRARSISNPVLPFLELPSGATNNPPVPTFRPPLDHTRAREPYPPVSPPPPVLQTPPWTSSLRSCKGVAMRVRQKSGPSSILLGSHRPRKETRDAPATRAGTENGRPFGRQAPRVPKRRRRRARPPGEASSFAARPSLPPCCPARPASRSRA